MYAFVWGSSPRKGVRLVLVSTDEASSINRYTHMS